MKLTSIEILQAVRGLTVEDKAAVLSELMGQHVNDGSGNLFRGLDYVAAGCKDPVGIRALWNLVRFYPEGGPFKAHRDGVKRHLAENHHIAADIVDYFIDEKDENFIEEAVIYGNTEKSGPVVSNYGQVERIVHSFDPQSTDTLKFIHNNWTLIPAEMLNVFLLRWVMTINNGNSYSNSWWRTATVEKIGQDERVDAEVLKTAWFQLTDDSHRIKLLKGKRFPEDLLQAICDDLFSPEPKVHYSSSIKQAVLQSEALPEHLTWYASNDQKSWPMLAESPALPREVAELMVMQGDVRVAKALLRNETLPEDIWNEVLAKLLTENPSRIDNDHDYHKAGQVNSLNLARLARNEPDKLYHGRIKAYAENPKTDEDTILVLIGKARDENNVFYAIAAVVNSRESLSGEIIEKLEKLISGRKSCAFDAWKAIVEHKNTNKQTLIRIGKMKTERVALPARERLEELGYVRKTRKKRNPEAAPEPESGDAGEPADPDDQEAAEA